MFVKVQNILGPPSFPSRTTLSLLPCRVKFRERVVYKFLLFPFSSFTSKGSGAGESRKESFKREITKCPRSLKWEKNWKETIGSGISESWVSFPESNFSGLTLERIREEMYGGETLQRMEWTTDIGKWR